MCILHVCWEQPNGNGVEKIFDAVKVSREIGFDIPPNEIIGITNCVYLFIFRDKISSNLLLDVFDSIGASVGK